MSEGSLVRATGLAAVFFAVSIGFGVAAVFRDPGVGAEVMALFSEQVVAGLLSDSPAVLAVKLFLNNLSTCLLLFLGGVSLGVVTVLILSVNGLLIGAVTELVRQQQGMLYIAAALLPHGIFEIPAFLIAGGLGLLLGREVIAEWHGSGDAAAGALPLARLFLRVVVPLLAVAAAVEAFITPAILSMIA
ncbi:stage II sporulation protein M [Methanoculleus sp. YWC-01]|jgi:stage II sporulation protein M|uniref:Stage II sporulation protein M n=1 Tax=Methanoculleus nereidis TaxID=2735141 RepID=A0ABU3Z1W0_9EURY|nr:stage II sporulation protein M [Methanoculleus sp. YWC-01]MCK9297985.1 stage II sporulation protein M [Methanoculleus sp.]MDV4342795.1 stage II sporulation protein M [Methanoculleus sp. YWC-01]PKL56617.1 MAG: stage II sporulation protein M [Methanomicrobiales archaeon HGW-Methanomicrobiales-6]